MIRLLISILCALGLAFAPVTVNAAPMPSDEMTGCEMDGKMPPEPMTHMNHSKADCCTAACPVQSSALLPDADAARPSDPALAALLFSAPVKVLISVAYSGLDPPPRA